MKAVTLPARLDTATADQLWSELSGGTDQDIILDGAMVEVFGARCLEVILTARQLCEGSGKSLVIRSLSQAAEKDLNTLGLSSQDFSAGDAQ